MPAESAIPSSFLLEGFGFHVGLGPAMHFGYEQVAKLVTCGKVNPNLF